MAGGSEADIRVFKELELDFLPEGSIIWAEKAYTQITTRRTSSRRGGGLHLKAKRAQEELQEAYGSMGGVLGQEPIRQYIERVLSGLRSLFVTFYSARYRKILTTKRAGAPKGSGSL
ncbi:MAG: hypothetical protein QOI57_3191 [Rubrobacteraceae bacterium]|nr:hypothetical protein [Rubrobacteraceae bacterium]